MPIQSALHLVDMVAVARRTRHDLGKEEGERNSRGRTALSSGSLLYFSSMTPRELPPKALVYAQ